MHAYSTFSRIIRTPVGIFGCQRMTALAMRLLSVFCHRTISSEKIFSMADRLQVIGVDTSAVPAEMI